MACVWFQLKAPHRAVLAIALIVMMVAALAWLCVRDPQIAFLVGDDRAKWILFPSSPNVVPHRMADLDAVFRREFVLDGQPRTARLSLRAARRVRLKINGQPVGMETSRNWKDFSHADVPGLLRVGTNTIEVRVFNGDGPPALWLVLVTDQLTLRSDQNWETSFAGSAWRRAALATTPRIPGRGNPMAGGEGTLAALAVVWPIWVGIVGLSIVIWLAGRWWLGRARTPNSVAGLSRREATVLLTIIAALWVALFCNNARSITCAAGFDARDHVDYIGYIQKHGRLPLPSEGWEMYQPPLYYVISATALSSFGLSVTDEAAGAILRLLMMLFGITHFTLVFLSLRLLFRGQIGRQMVGLVLAGFLPMQLYLSHYVTNETLTATFATAAVFLCLHLLRAEHATLTGHAGLGFCLGAAMLTKATGVLLVPFIVVAVAGKLAAEKSPLVNRLRNLGVTLAICFAVCGWYYIWIWSHFGTPLVGNWDAVSRFHWWQDNGYHTATDFARFGRSLVHPLFSGFAGFADGIYSTLWGDGLCGGRRDMNDRPPWNYDLMIAGYLLALAPTLMILTGAAVSLLHFIRKPSAEWFVLLGLSGTMVFALFFMNLKVPSYAQAKAFYGLCALVPLCSFGAAGWEVMTRGCKWLQFLFGTVLLVWAMNSFASVWIRSRSAPAHIHLGRMLADENRMAAAELEFADAVNRDPANAPARRFLALTLNELGKTDEALQLAEQAVELEPTNAAGHYILSVILAGQGQTKRAIGEAQRAVELGPEYLPPYPLLAGLLPELGRTDEAIHVARDGLAVNPINPELHYTLGVMLARKGDFASATNQFAYALLLKPAWADVHLTFGQVFLLLGDAPNGLRHFQEAVRLAPDWPPALNGLAWLLATHPDATVRNGPEALRLAKQACAATGHGDPGFLDTLAAAYAEAGRFPEAVNAAQEAIALARTAGDEAAVNQTEDMLGFFRSGRPFRENPKPLP
jgi:tetratricopeptide (TPR) repeat protein